MKKNQSINIFVFLRESASDSAGERIFRLQILLNIAGRPKRDADSVADGVSGIDTEDDADDSAPSEILSAEGAAMRLAVPENGATLPRRGDEDGVVRLTSPAS